MINKNAQFNREKVPERVVHARGMTAKGFFEVCAITRSRQPCCGNVVTLRVICRWEFCVHSQLILHGTRHAP